jgi:hypothetical protein
MVNELTITCRNVISVNRLTKRNETQWRLKALTRARNEKEVEGNGYVRAKKRKMSLVSELENEQREWKKLREYM